jgi:hypothetical protein
MEKIKSSIIIGVAIIITAFILGKSFQNRNENLDSISVIGLGTKDFFQMKFFGLEVLRRTLSILK